MMESGRRQEGLDISHYQNEGSGAIDWAQLAPDRSGKTFVVIKASQRSDYQDPHFVENWRNATNAAVGLQAGAYHFIEFDIENPSVGSPAVQMANFMGQLRRARGRDDWTHPETHRRTDLTHRSDW